MTARIRRIEPGAPGRDRLLAALTRRVLEIPAEVERAVAAILGDVRERGDAAVRDHTERLDRRSPTGPDGSYELSPARRAELAARAPAGVVRALERAAERIRSFHAKQLSSGYAIEEGALELRAVPLACAGLYVPGGTALYPSSVLMGAIPARVAGVDEIIMTTPGASPEVLAAAAIAGIDRVFEIGGAQAIGALAYGTVSVPKVDKIVGPGNQFVAAAKRRVYGVVDIDSIAGPSEVLIVADDSADPAWVAADLLAQAEHDTEARPILVSTSTSLLDAVAGELDRQLADLPRREVAAAALERGGALVLTADLEEAIAFAERYAPEHLELCVENAPEVARRIRRAGAVFVGSFSPEAAGDYTAGPNHVLPTGGAARYASPLGVYDFQKYVSVIHLSREGLAAQADDIATIARAEGLEAHARSVEARFQDPPDRPAARLPEDD